MSKINSLISGSNWIWQFSRFGKSRARGAVIFIFYLSVFRGRAIFRLKMWQKRLRQLASKEHTFKNAQAIFPGFVSLCFSIASRKSPYLFKYCTILQEDDGDEEVRRELQLPSLLLSSSPLPRKAANALFPLSLFMVRVFAHILEILEGE